MSIYRMVIAGVAAMSLATAVMATPAKTDGTTKTPVAATQAIEGKVDINKASSKDLGKVAGMNASKARAIVAFRKKHGDFKSLDDLKQVSGFKRMNDQNLKSIQDQLTMG